MNRLISEIGSIILEGCKFGIFAGIFVSIAIPVAFFFGWIVALFSSFSIEISLRGELLPLMIEGVPFTAFVVFVVFVSWQAMKLGLREAKNSWKQLKGKYPHA